MGSALTLTWLDRFTQAVAPRWTLDRVRARAAMHLLARHYEAAGTGRRTSSWNRSAADVNAVIGPALAGLRASARDLVRNNPYAESALSTIVDHAVGWGIEAKAPNARIAKRWAEWAGTTACDADGRHDFAGLQKLVMREVVESGEVLVRRRWRRLTDGYPLPLQLQVLEADFLDTGKDTATWTASSGGKRIIQGVQFDALGRREGYWLFKEHPGSTLSLSSTSEFVPAAEIQHLFRPLRAGQVRGPSWFAPALLRFKDSDEFEDATLMKQKIAACLAVITSDVDGATLGEEDEDDDRVDMLEPGAIINAPAGRNIEVVQPPTTSEYGEYMKTVLRAIATGLGVTYEDLTGDYSNMPFSAARMSRLRHEARVHDWRWRILIPQFCDPAWAWAMQAIAVVDGIEAPGRPSWTPPPLPMVDPEKEGRANAQRVRTGQTSLSEVLRGQGYDPAAILDELAKDFELLDKLGLVLDIDPRQMTSQGQKHGSAKPADPNAAPAKPPKPKDEDEDPATDPDDDTEDPENEEDEDV